MVSSESLEDAGVGLPAYYEWRTRSGCYFCFFQRKAEWVGLAERHPALFEKAIGYEENADKNHRDYGMQERRFTWSPGEPLPLLVERREEIMERHAASMQRAASRRKNLPLIEVLGAALDDDDDAQACQVCI